MPAFRVLSLVVSLVLVSPLAVASRASAQHVHDGDGGGAAAPALRVATVARTAEGIRIDGRLEEDAWATASPVSAFVQQKPRAGEPAAWRTEVRILQDDEALYLGARLRDPAPDSIVVRMARRDETVHADMFTVFLDTYRDRRSGFGFGVSAAGIQHDVRLFEDNRRDASWDAVWASATTVDEEGWTAELRIPLAQLRYTGSETGAWGLELERTVARSNEVSHWAAVPEDAEGFVSLFGELAGVETGGAGRGIELVPYLVARATAAPGANADPLQEAVEPDLSLGADLRVGLTPGLTLSATFNPDFGQVEADPAQVNLTAFELFQSERRPFFVEGADILQMSHPMWPPLFYSRRIGRAPQAAAPEEAAWTDAPEASTILGAAKVTGQVGGGWSVGALGAVTASESADYLDGEGRPGRTEVEPLTGYAVARLARQFRDGRSGVGVIGTFTARELGEERLAFLHANALAGGVDGWHRFDADEWEVRFGGTFSRVAGDSVAIARTQRAAGHYFQRPDAPHVDDDPGRTELGGYSTNLSLRRLRGAWRVGANLEATSPGYEIADLGFNPSLDRVWLSAWVRYQDFTPGRLFRSWSLGSFLMSQRTFGGERLELTQDLGLDFELPSYWGGGVWLMRHAPAWSTTALRGGPALQRPGRWMGNVHGNSDRRRGLVGDAFLFWEAEDEGGGWTLDASANLAWRPSDRFTLKAGPYLSTGRGSWQYVARKTLAGEPLWLVGDLRQRTWALTARADWIFSRALTLQTYVRPYLASGSHQRFREVADPRADRFGERFTTYPADAVRAGESGVSLDRDGDGAADLEITPPDYNTRSLQLNTVLRWEYRPGSTLFLVWTHDRHASDHAPFALGPDLARLRETPGRNVLLLKASWWMPF